MTAIDRLAQGYEPDFDIDYAAGAQGELFVAHIIESLTAGSASIEVKTDAQVARTGNVYIEYECLRGGKYVPSGIAATKADLWAFVLPASVLIVAPVTSVRDVARRHFRRRVECLRGDHPTRGVIVPVGLFVKDLYQYEVSAA